MSKKRPSQRRSKPFAPPVSRLDPSYWETRLFHNSYSYRGELRRVGGWSVKIQCRGVRRTVSLEAPDRRAAAKEARDLYASLARSGWGAAVGAASRRGGGDAKLAPMPAEEPAATRSSLADWRSRLVLRRYAEGLGGLAGREYSAPIAHEGNRWWFPLATDDLEEASRRAAALSQELATVGWERGLATIPRELTISVVWHRDPFACTYATYHSMPAPQLPRGAPAKSAVRRQPCVVVIEPEAAIRRVLQHWLERDSPLRVLGAASDEEARRVMADNRVRLILFNQRSEEQLGNEWLEQLGQEKPLLTVYGYGVYGESDQIFASIGGIDGGYLLRRRPPEQLLEPVSACLGKTRATRADAEAAVRRYFRDLFDSPVHATDAGDPGKLTLRERSILDFLVQGLLDKEIAERLGISRWTVRNHLNHLYRKLRVHTRTEAVVRYLQK